MVPEEGWRMAVVLRRNRVGDGIWLSVQGEQA
jgi:hypothetical protein